MSKVEKSPREEKELLEALEELERLLAEVKALNEEEARKKSTKS